MAEDNFPTFSVPHMKLREPREEAPIAVDTAKAFDELEAWIQRGAELRSCWCLEKRKGRWKVGLSADQGDSIEPERLTAGEDRELRGAIRNALMIAMYAGFR